MNSHEKRKSADDFLKGYSSKDMELRIIKNFLDIIILIEMKKQSSLSGYDLVSFINNKFGGMLSPGTVYSTLYAMERKKLIEGVPDGRKTVYKLTEQGEAVVNSMMANFNEEMESFARKFLTL